MQINDGYIFPGIDEDPREGCQMIDSSRFRCMKCIRYGGINSDDLRVTP